MKLRLFLSIFLLMFAGSVSAQAIMDTKYGQQQDPTNLSDQDKDLSYWLDVCLAFNPLAKASPRKKKPKKK